MRILIINTSEKTGGAAVASNRLLSALSNNGVKAKMLVRNKETDHLSVVSLPHSLKQKLERFSKAANLWCGQCTICGQLRLFATMPVGVLHLKQVASAANCCLITDL